MWKPIRKFLCSEDGPTSAEYAVMLAAIFLVALASILSLGGKASLLWQANSVSMSDAGLKR